MNCVSDAPSVSGPQESVWRQVWGPSWMEQYRGGAHWGGVTGAFWSWQRTRCCEEGPGRTPRKRTLSGSGGRRVSGTTVNCRGKSDRGCRVAAESLGTI